MSPDAVSTLLWSALWTDCQSEGPAGKAPSLTGYTAGHSRTSVPVSGSFQAGRWEARQTGGRQKKERDQVTDSQAPSSYPVGLAVVRLLSSARWHLSYPLGPLRPAVVKASLLRGP